MSMRWRWFAVVGALAVGASAWAGGVMGTDAPARVPVPAAQFTALVNDKAGVELSIDRTTFNGEVFFYGVLGEGSVTIPFDRVASARFEPSQTQGKVVLFATMLDGQTARILVDDDLPLYGVAPFGNYSIEAGDLRSVRITPTPVSQTPAP